MSGEEDDDEAMALRHTSSLEKAIHFVRLLSVDSHAMWMVEDKEGKWFVFPDELQAPMEAAFKQWVAFGSSPNRPYHEYRKGRGRYEVNFSTMHQTRKDTGKTRKILRTPNPHYTVA